MNAVELISELTTLTNTLKNANPTTDTTKMVWPRQLYETLRDYDKMTHEWTKSYEWKEIFEKMGIKFFDDLNKTKKHCLDQCIGWDYVRIELPDGWTYKKTRWAYGSNYKIINEKGRVIVRATDNVDYGRVRDAHAYYGEFLKDEED